MGKFEKAYARFMARPAPKDVTPEEVIYLAERLGFRVTSGGKHPIKITDDTSQTMFPVPVKNGIVKPFYISKLQEWFKEKETEGQQ